MTYHTPDWLIRALARLNAALPCQCPWCRLRRWARRVWPLRWPSG